MAVSLKAALDGLPGQLAADPALDLEAYAAGRQDDNGR
jgi:hypothetical protein